MVIGRKKTFLEAHIGTFSTRDSLYDLGKIKAPLSKEFFQASCEMKRFLRRGK